MADTFLDNTVGGAMDQCLQHVVNNANEVWYLADYTLGDDWATVSSNKRGSVAINSGDWSPISTHSQGRRAQFNGKDGGLAIAGPTVTDGHVAFVATGTSTILWITDETTDRNVIDNDPLTFPQTYIQINQPQVV